MCVYFNLLFEITYYSEIIWDLQGNWKNSTELLKEAELP